MCWPATERQESAFLKVLLTQIVISLAFFFLLVADANAVGVYRPPCDKEQNAVDSRKEDLDKCVAKFESENKDEKRPPLTSSSEKDLPCMSEFRALLSAEDGLNKCMENQIWWKPKKK
ncbi:MAG: hypothetical protein ACXWP1_03915 [Bdellovibrionota bacterium]